MMRVLALVTVAVVVVAVVVAEAMVVVESLEVGPFAFVRDLTRRLKFHLYARITTEDFVRVVVMLLEVATIKMTLHLFHPVCLETAVMVSILGRAPGHEIMEAVAVLVVPVVIMVLLIVVKVVLVLVEVVTAMVSLHPCYPDCCCDSRMTLSIPGHFADHQKTKVVVLPAPVMIAVRVVLVEVVMAKVAFLPYCTWC